VQDIYRVGPSTMLHVLLTGQPSNAEVQVLVDGVPPERVDSDQPNELRFRTTQVAPGPHTVTLNRAGWLMTFSYFTGEFVPPPPPPPGPPGPPQPPPPPPPPPGPPPGPQPPLPQPGNPCVAAPVRLTVIWPDDPKVTQITVTDNRGCPPIIITR
jgi:hypothetical protein